MIYNNNKSDNVGIFSKRYTHNKIICSYAFTSKELSQKPILNVKNIKYKRNFNLSNNFKK